jgi:nicotinamidase-related amidase
MLVSSSVDTLIVAGATTSGCVRASVVDAVQYGFDTFVVRDCVADRAAAPHEANLFDMEAKYATLMNSDQVVQYIRSGNIPK